MLNTFLKNTIFLMEQITLSLESIHIKPTIIQQKIKQNANTFKVISGSNIFLVDPIPAIQFAKIDFEGYSRCKTTGQITIREYRPEYVQAVINFFHGFPLVINRINLEELLKISNDLGIPIIENAIETFIRAFDGNI